MSGLIHIGAQPTQTGVPVCAAVRRSSAVFWLQGVTLGWMMIECGASLYAAAAAHSPALLAFGSDSLVELFSAAVVLMPYLSPSALSERRAARIAGVLLFVLALMVASTAAVSLLFHLGAETSFLGMLVTIAALIAMPVLAGLKRREARRTKNLALAADAVQSATCAYLALVTLAGLAINRVFHAPWMDALAALVAVPILIHEGRSAWRGHACSCC